MSFEELNEDCKLLCELFHDDNIEEKECTVLMVNDMGEQVEVIYEYDQENVATFIVDKKNTQYNYENITIKIKI